MLPLTQRTALFYFFLLTFSFVSAQTADDTNEGSRLVPDTTPGYFSFSWWGREDWTYFVQNSDDLRTWTYLPIIEQGEDAIISYGFAADATIPFFLRLRLTDQPAADPWATDFGAGLPAGFALEHGLDPFDPEVGTSDSPYVTVAWTDYYEAQQELVAYYPLSEVEPGGMVPDHSGNGYHGQLTGSHASFGQIGQLHALKVEGNHSGVVLPSVPALDDLPANSYTISVWYKATDLPGTNGLHGDFAIVSKNTDFAIRLASAPRFRARFNQQDTSGTVLTQISSPIYPNWERWYHLTQVVDYDTGQVRFYANGQLLSTGAFDNTLPPVATSQPWRIGFRNTSSSSHWSARGWFRDLRIYGRPLTAPEVSSLWHMTPPAMETHHDGIPAWWKLQNFGTLDVDSEADPDGDGRSNLFEYILGSDPNSPTSFTAYAPGTEPEPPEVDFPLPLYGLIDLGKDVWIASNMSKSGWLALYSMDENRLYRWHWGVEQTLEVAASHLFSELHHITDDGIVLGGSAMNDEAYGQIPAYLGGFERFTQMVACAWFLGDSHPTPIEWSHELTVAYSLDNGVVVNEEYYGDENAIYFSNGGTLAYGFAFHWNSWRYVPIKVSIANGMVTLDSIILDLPEHISYHPYLVNRQGDIVYVKSNHGTEYYLNEIADPLSLYPTDMNDNGLILGREYGSNDPIFHDGTSKVGDAPFIGLMNSPSENEPLVIVSTYSSSSGNTYAIQNRDPETGLLIPLDAPDAFSLHNFWDIIPQNGNWDVSSTNAQVMSPCGTLVAGYGDYHPQGRDPETGELLGEPEEHAFLSVKASLIPHWPGPIEGAFDWVDSGGFPRKAVLHPVEDRDNVYLVVNDDNNRCRPIPVNPDTEPYPEDWDNGGGNLTLGWNDDDAVLVRVIPPAADFKTGTLKIRTSADEDPEPPLRFYIGTARWQHGILLTDFEIDLENPDPNSQLKPLADGEEMKLFVEGIDAPLDVNPVDIWLSLEVGEDEFILSQFTLKILKSHIRYLRFIQHSRAQPIGISGWIEGLMQKSTNAVRQDNDYEGENDRIVPIQFRRRETIEIDDGDGSYDLSEVNPWDSAKRNKIVETLDQYNAQVYVVERIPSGSGGFVLVSGENIRTERFVITRLDNNRQPPTDNYLIAHEWLHAFGGLHHVCEQENIMVNTSDTTITCPPGTKKGPRVNEEQKNAFMNYVEPNL